MKPYGWGIVDKDGLMETTGSDERAMRSRKEHLNARYHHSGEYILSQAPFKLVQLFYKENENQSL